MTLQFKKNSYIQASAAGAYHCTNTVNSDSAQHFLTYLLACNETPLLTEILILEHLDSTLSTALKLLKYMQDLKWLQSFDEPQKVTPGALEDILPDILMPLSLDKKIMLADAQGFYISTVGFAHETAEELAALSADLGSLYERHKGLLAGNLNCNGQNWSMVDAGGYSKLGFWPLHINKGRPDKETFTLIISGFPKLEHPNFLSLVWTLFERYSSKTDMDGSMDSVVEHIAQ